MGCAPPLGRHPRVGRRAGGLNIRGGAKAARSRASARQSPASARARLGLTSQPRKRPASHTATSLRRSAPPPLDRAERRQRRGSRQRPPGRRLVRANGLGGACLPARQGAQGGRERALVNATATTPAPAFRACAASGSPAGSASSRADCRPGRDRRSLCQNVVTVDATHVPVCHGALQDAPPSSDEPRTSRNAGITDPT